MFELQSSDGSTKLLKAATVVSGCLLMLASVTLVLVSVVPLSIDSSTADGIRAWSIGFMIPTFLLSLALLLVKAARDRRSGNK